MAFRAEKVTVTTAATLLATGSGKTHVRFQNPSGAFFYGHDNTVTISTGVDINQVSGEVVLQDGDELWGVSSGTISVYVVVQS